MNRYLSILLFLLLAIPAFAQDDVDFDRDGGREADRDARGHETRDLDEREHEAPGFDEREFEMGGLAGRQYLEQLREHGIDAASIRDAWLSTRGREGKDASRAASAATWEFLGPRNQAGRIMGLAIGMENTSRWYCAADGGGIWRSMDAGGTWTPLTDTLPSLRMGALAVSPRNDLLVLGGTHEGMVYRSIDGGQSWSVIAIPGGYIHDIQFHPTKAGEVMIGAEGGLYRSTDDGATWTKLRPGGRVLTVTYHPTDPLRIFYGHNDEGGEGHIWRTTDGGATWKELYKRSAGYWSNVGVRLCAAQPKVLYAAFADQDIFVKSTDGGDTWKELPTQPYRDGYMRGFDIFAVSPIDPDIVMSGSTGIFRTTDGGATWSAGDTINKNLHVDQHAMLFPPQLIGQFISGNDGGVFRTVDYSNPTLAWEVRNRDLVTLQIYNCAIHPKQEDTIIVGCQDNGYDKFTGDEYNWLVVGGDGFCTIYDRDQPAYFYHEYVYQNLHRANNGFTWWSTKTMRGLPTDSSDQGFYTGIVSPDRVDWYGQGIAMSPADSKTLYMGTNFLYKTTDRAEHWRLVSDEEYSRDESDCITSILPAPGAASRIYIGTSRGKLYKTIDAGSSATTTDITPAFGTSGRVRGIAVSPADPDLVYAGGDGGYDGKGVLMSTNGGSTWVVRSEGLPQAGVNRLVADPDSAGTLYCATTSGLYFTRDGGAHWLPMPGLPNVEVWDIAFDARVRTILLGTYGRGAIRARNFVPPAYTPPASVAQENAAGAKLDLLAGGDGATVRLTLPTSRTVAITLYDLLGRVAARIHDGYLSAGTHQFSLGADHQLALPSGVYFIEARGDGIALQARCVITR